MSATPSEPTQPILTDERLQVLVDEAQRLQTLYLDSRNNAQSVFNFYLSFVTAVTGGLVLILQTATDIASLQTRIILVLLLFFATLVGSVYLSALSGRYAQAARFAHALDAVRRLQLQLTKPPLPRIYDGFIAEPDDSTTQPADSWYLWLVPSGTFQMFIAIVNSTALALAVGLLLSLGDVQALTILGTGLFIFLLMLTIYNAYARLVFRRFTRVLDVRVDMGRRLGLWAARE